MAAFEQIYLGCALTHVPRPMFGEYSEFLHGLAAALRTHFDGCDVKYALTHSDPQLASNPFAERARLCYLWDTQMVAASDLLIAEVSFPSTGLGIELQVAASKGIPIILCYRNFSVNRATPIRYQNPDMRTYSLQIGEGYISLMALGIPGVFRLVRYDSNLDGIRDVVAVADILSNTAESL
jgi:hypothetical protein